MATSQRPRSSSRRQHTDVVTLTANACGLGALAAVVGLSIVLIVTIGTWALAPHGPDASPQAAVRLAAGLWLLAHHVPLDLPTGPLKLMPLGLMLLPVAMMYAAGRQLARVLLPKTLADVVRAVIPFALTYGVIAAIVAGLSGSDTVRPHAWAAFVATAFLALLAGGAGLVRRAGLGSQVRSLVPPILSEALTGAAAGLATLLAFGAAVTALCLAIGFPDSVEMFGALDPDITGGAVLALLSVAFVPNLVVWATAFSTGVGFTLGTGGSVSPRGVEYGPLPVFPPLSALPPEGTPGVLAVVALVAPLCAGVATGWIVRRRLPTATSEQVVGRAALGGVLCGAGLAALCWFTSGSVASGQLSEVGPVAWKVGLVTALEVGLVAAATAWEAHRRSWSGGSITVLRDRVMALRSR
ncbi:MAG TPA: DUF6350 family protein [Actinomycetes bacterium]|nr:DUF6350 family protein [Actinomycetes bacterium]